jgi:hypothetical protein
MALIIGASIPAGRLALILRDITPARSFRRLEIASRSDGRRQPTAEGSHPRSRINAERCDHVAAGSVPVFGEDLPYALPPYGDRFRPGSTPCRPTTG